MSTRLKIKCAFSQGSVKGTSGVLRWTVGTQTDLVLSVMWSVPYNRQLWNTWVAIGLTNGTLGYEQAYYSEFLCWFAEYAVLRFSLKNEKLS